MGPGLPAPEKTKGYWTPLTHHSIMSLMIFFNVRLIDIPLFLCFSFWFKPSVRSACHSISQSLRDCVSQTTLEWIRSSSFPCVWQWIFLRSVTWQRPSGTLEHGANLLPGEGSHMTPAISWGSWGWGGTWVRQPNVGMIVRKEVCRSSELGRGEILSIQSNKVAAARSQCSL